MNAISPAQSEFFGNAKSIQEIVDILNRDVNAKGFSIRFENVRRDGETIFGNLIIRWEEKIFGRTWVIIDQNIPFAIKGRQRIFEVEIPIAFGIKIKAYCDVFFDPPNRICAEARAEWPGGSVGTGAQCHTF